MTNFENAITPNETYEPKPPTDSANPKPSQITDGDYWARVKKVYKSVSKKNKVPQVTWELEVHEGSIRERL